MISKSCKYAIRAALYIASKIDEKVKLSVKEIAFEIDAPEAFTAKILQNLTRHKIIFSTKGPYGGFYVEQSNLKIPLINIVNAIDGLSIFEDCGIGLQECSDIHPCPFHNDYKVIRNGILSIYKNNTIGKFSKELMSGETFLKSI